MVGRVFGLLVCLVLAGAAAGAFAREPKAPQRKTAEEEEQGKEKSEGGLDEEWILQEDADYPDLVGVDDQSEVMDEFALLQEQDVVFSAARHRQKTGFSPSAVIVITKEQIQESGAFTLLELLRRYPEVNVFQHDPMYPSADIRGTVRVILLVDGRGVNLEFFQSPFFTAMPAGMNSIERIEIVLGPNSALYGADAVAAVINVVTRKPSGKFEADVELAAGEHGTNILDGAVQGGVGPVSGRLTFGIDQADSWMQRELHSKRLARVEGIVRLELSGGDLLLRGGMLAGSGRFFGGVGYFDFAEYQIPYAQANLEISDLKVQAVYHGLRTSYDFLMGLVEPNLGELGRMPHFCTDGDTFQAGVQYDLEPFEGNLLIGGIDGRFTSYREDEFVNPDVQEYRLGVFVHDEQRFAEKVLVTLGARFDYNSISDAAVSPRAAVVYNPAGEHFLRLSGGMAFRKPTLLESSVNFHIVANPAFPEVAEIFEKYGPSNPDLSNEKLMMFEAGYRGALLDGALRLGADAYFGSSWDNILFSSYVHVEDTPLGPRIVPEESRVRYDNTGHDDMIIGVNAGATWEPDESLSLFFKGEFRHGWLTKDSSRNPWVVKLQAVAGGTLRTDSGFTLHLAGVYTGSRGRAIRNPESIMLPEIPSEAPPRFYLLAAARYAFKLGDSRVDLGLSLFNPFAGRFREQTGTRAADGSNYGGELVGRRAMFSARIRY
jgi:outer membrane receptor for ferrienterochelin and colicin